MPIDMNGQIIGANPNDVERAVLANLQGNILKGHGRDHTVNLFLGFNQSELPQVKKLVSTVGESVTSALDQLEQAREYRRSKVSGGTFATFLLSAAGYRVLQLDERMPNERAFCDGMKQRGKELLDPHEDTWNEHFQTEIHALLIIADDNPAQVAATRDHWLREMGATVKVLGQEIGLAQRNSEGRGIEHFNYVDGRSQPLFFNEDIEAEKQKEGIDKWDPTFPLKQVLVPCPSGEKDGFGSYFVFRKLEENVRGFKAHGKQLGKFLKLGDGVLLADDKHEQEELAGALVVGRFENGTPTVLHNHPSELAIVPNNFNYDDDPNGLKCPLHGHIRKSNPRGESVKKFEGETTLEQERSHIMARRGITYGHRAIHPSDPAIRLEEMPTGDVGLLFMAYQSNIENQFEFTQKFWVNNVNFVAEDTGIDPVIGQKTAAKGSRWPVAWGESEKSERFDFSGFVTLLGGEYFFAPCISFLKHLS